MPNTTKGGKGPIICRYLYFREGRENSTKWVKIPVVAITLRGPEAEYQTLALVDSGSDRTFLQKQDAEALGLKPQTRRDGSNVTVNALGAGASFDCDVMVIPELSLMNKNAPFHIFRSMQVWVPRTNGTLPISILGRDHLFRHFDITFQEGRKQIAFRRP